MKVRYPELKKVVDRINLTRVLTVAGPITHQNINQDKAEYVFRHIDLELHPEWLHCDGEITADEAAKKEAMLRTAADQLCELGYSIPHDLYNL